MTVVCLLDDAPDSAPRLYMAGAEGRAVPVDAATAAADTGPVIAVLPGTAVLLRTVTLPVKTEGQARTAAVFALEDELAAEPESLHFALGPRQADGNRAVAVIAADCMDSWLAQMRELGLTPDTMVPDFLTLSGQRPGAARFEGRTLVRQAELGGFAIEEDLFDAVLDAGERAALPPPRDIAPADLASEATSAAAEPVLNLLQGRYRPQRSRPSWLALGRRAGALAAAALVLWLGVTLADAWRLKALDDHYYRAAQDMARAALPEGTRLIDPVRQLRRAQTGAAGAGGEAAQNGFLPLSAMLIEALAEVPAAEVRSLRYRAEQAALSAEIGYSAFADLEALDAAVRAAGGVLTERGARQEGSRVIGRVELSRAGGAGP